MLTFLAETIRNASRIAVIDGGGVCEIGTHDELMAKPEGRYKDLQVLQDLKNATSLSGGRIGKGGDGKDTDKKISQAEDTVAVTGRKGNGDSIGKEKGKELALKASLFGKEDRLYFFVGGVGAVLTGLMVSEAREGYDSHFYPTNIVYLYSSPHGVLCLRT